MAHERFFNTNHESLTKGEKISIVYLLVLPSSDQLIFVLKLFFTIQPIFIRGPIVLSLSLLLVFDVSKFVFQIQTYILYQEMNAELEDRIQKAELDSGFGVRRLENFF